MPKTKISEFSATPANNTDIDSINIAEGCAPSGINDAIRELMAQLKDFQTGAVGDSFNGPIGTSTAAAGAFTTLSASSTVTLSGGTANGVAYLNGSKVVTSGSALTFDGTNLSVGAAGSSSTWGKFVSVDGNYPGIVFNSTAASGRKFSVGVDATQWLVRDETAGATRYLIDSSGNSIWSVGGSEQMRLTSTGLGIGTSSPSAKLHVSGGARIADSTNSANYITIGSGNEAPYGNNSIVSQTGSFSIGTVAASTNLILLTAGTEKARLDSSGVLGLGVTPAAWGSSIGKTLQINTGGSFSADLANAYFAANSYYNGTNWIYQTSTHATRYTLGSNFHAWYTAPTGTAGNAITFTQSMTLTSGSTLLIDTTSDNGATGFAFIGSGTSSVQRLIIGHPSSNGSGSQYHDFYYNGGSIGSITQVGTTAVAYNISSDYRLKNITGSITTSGAYIDSLNPVEGTWKSDGSTFVGLIAHEVQEASRTIVATGTKDGAEMQAMDYSNSELIANLIAEVKSLRQRVATLEAQ